MINETIIVLARLEDLSKHRLAKHHSSLWQVYFTHDINFYQPLQQIFSRVIPYDYTKRIAEIGIKGVNQEIIELVKKEHPKYVFRMPVGYLFQESTIDSIREEGSIVVGWFGDDEFEFDGYSRWWIPHLDYCITHDIEAVPKYRALGARVIQTIHCRGIPVDRDWSDIEEKYQVSFVGSNIADREDWINKLKERNIPVALFGPGWGAGHIPFEQMLDIFKTSKINLSFSKVTRSKRISFKGRLTEVCLAGGFLLTEYIPGIENYFEIDKEIVCFHNVEEMIDKISYYLSHDEERRAIAQAGWKRATSEYTAFHMLSRVFDEIERDIAVKGKPSHPRELKLPIWLRRRFSISYLDWLMAFALAGDKGLCRDTFVLSISYYPFNIWAWYYYLASFLPYPLRLGAYKLGRLGFGASRRLLLLGTPLLRLASIPYLRKIGKR